MPLNITNTGTGPSQRKGTIGPVVGGWSEQEFATPVSPAETAGGTGMLSYSAGENEESLLIINNAVTATHTDAVRPLGSVDGVIRTVAQTGLNVSMTQDNKLAQFDTDRTIPPIGAASVPVALRLADLLVNEGSGFNGTSGYFWSLDGHEVGFDPDGVRVQPESSVQEYQKYNPATGELESSGPIVTFQGTLNSGGFTVFNDTLYATDVTGDSFVLESAPGVFSGLQTSSTKMILMGKILLDGQDFELVLQGLPYGPADGDYAQTITCSIDYSADTMTISVERRTGGTITVTTDTTSIASLDRDTELAFRFYWTYAGLPSALPPVEYSTSFSLCNTSDYATIVAVDVDNYAADNPGSSLSPLWFDPWTITGNVRALWYRFGLETTTNPVTWPVGERQDWETGTPSTIIVDGPETAGPPALGFTGNVWQYLQNACTAYGWEIGLEGDQITSRPIGGRFLNITNYAPTPTVTPTTTFTGRQVNVEYTNAALSFGGELYNAREDDNRVISVGAGEVTTVVVAQDDVFPIVAIDPIRVTTFVPGQGTYFVIDSTGLPIVADQWEDYGGSVTVALNPDIAGGIQVTVTGPSEEIPSTTGPYSLAVSDGSNQYAALSILGSGVIADRETLELLTGADPSKTPQQIATTIVNPFIATLEQAYDSGIWATVDASGPRVSFNVTIPINALQGFGQTAGSLVNWGQSTYRVVSASVGSLGATLECVRHVTVGQFDDVWNGLDVDDHDTVWDSYICEDQRIIPYKA
jgi:hypothetical protein